MEMHEEYTQWALQRGIEINGIAAHGLKGEDLILLPKRDTSCPQYILRLEVVFICLILQYFVLQKTFLSNFVSCLPGGHFVQWVARSSQPLCSISSFEGLSVLEI